MTTTDPRPARTRALLLSTLLELISEKRWEKIRVQDVLERSGVGRSTFYNHFTNKFDLLSAAIPDHAVTMTNDEGLNEFFAHVEEMSPILRPLLSQPVLGEVAALFEDRLADAWHERLANESTSPAPDVAATARFLAGGQSAIIREWFRTGCEEPATVVLERVRGLTDAVLLDRQSYLSGSVTRAAG